MYKKAAGFLLLAEIVLAVVYFCVAGTNINRDDSVKTVFEIKLNHIMLADEKDSVIEISKTMRSEQRVLTYDVMERKVEADEAEVVSSTEIITLSQEDYNNLLRIVEAEASGEDEVGKILVANVVMNRVESEDFPDTITEVVFQKSNGVTQFSPVANGRFWSVSISEETIEAVNKALSGEDYSQGALYFAARKYADSDNMRWFDEKLDYLFTHGGHEFFAE